MEKIRLEPTGEISEAVAFANRQFGLDFLKFQPKLYAHKDAGGSCTLRQDGRIIGMVSFYPVSWNNLRCLSVGSVCTAPEARGQGVMTSLFAFLQEEIFPDYDVITLSGKKVRYERFGFAKALWFPEYWFYPQSGVPALQLRPIDRQDGEVLSTLWDTYGTGSLRRGERMADILQSAGHEACLLSDGAQVGYVSGRRQKGLLTEYCGPWPVQKVVDAMADLWKCAKIGILGQWNCHDEALLQSCDSFVIRNHGNIRLQTARTDLRDVYRKFGYGGRAPEYKFPSSLIYLDGI